MIPFDQVEDYIGHAPGVVCPFAVKPGVKACLDESLKRHAEVYPAAGSSNSAVRLTIPALEKYSAYTAWVDVTKTASTNPRLKSRACKSQEAFASLLALIRYGDLQVQGSLITRFIL